MLDNELRELGPPRTLDNTLRTAFSLCPRRFYWMQRGYDYSKKPAFFTWGSAWHECLHQWHKNWDMKIGERLDLSMGAGVDYWNENIGEVEPGPVDNLDNLVALFLKYAEAYPVDGWRLVGGEIGWRWPVGSTSIVVKNSSAYEIRRWTEKQRWYGGSMDGYVTWEGYGKLVLEHKSVNGYLSDGYLNQWSYAQQITGNIWGLTKMQGEDIFGCLMNLASKRIPKTSKGKTNLFSRRLEKRSPIRLEEFEGEVLRNFDQIEQEWDRWTWSMAVDPRECAGGIGKSPCLFRDICLVPIPFHEVDPLIYQGIRLRDEMWEPWKRRGEQTSGGERKKQ